MTINWRATNYSKFVIYVIYWNVNQMVFTSVDISKKRFDFTNGDKSPIAHINITMNSGESNYFFYKTTPHCHNNNNNNNNGENRITL